MLKYVLLAFVLLAVIAVIVEVLSSAGDSASEDGEANHNQQTGLPAR